MKCLLSLKASLAVLALACAAPAALAQTGPAVPLPPASPKVGAPLANPMTPERLADLLRREGHSSEIKTVLGGAKTVIATIVRDGWRFQMEFEFNTAGTNLNVLCPLGNAASQFSPAQLLALLKKSYDLPPPLHFSYRAADQRLCLEDACYVTGTLTDTGVRNILDRLIRTVRETHPLWDTSRWPVSGQPPAAGQLPTPPGA